MKFKEKPWYNQAVALCIAVILYVTLTNWGSVREGVGTFFHYFSPVILGVIIAYIVSPLSELYGRTLFCWIKKTRVKTFISNILAFITVILFLVFLLLMLVPQLIESVGTFAGNLDGYMASLHTWLDSLGVNASALDLDPFISSSEALIETLTEFIKKNLSVILSTSVGVGKGAVQFLIAFFLSIYLLSDKARLKGGIKTLIKAAFSGMKAEKVIKVLRRCHGILKRYIVFNLLDSLIVGSANAIFMAIVGMPYVGLVSFVVAVINLLPTFGPVIGAVIGGFVLLMVNPWHALAFLIFTLVLQTIDGYILKPKLFGDSLGVSGLWILVGVVVGGRAFGVVGILLAIPGVAMLDFLYREYFLPWLEAKKKEF
jgi:predicted PurR-regulated permease PerM